MDNEERVMVAVSTIEKPHAAIDWALSYAASIHRGVELVHVIDLSWQSTPAPVAESQLLDAEQKLRTLADHCETLGSVVVHPTVLVGHPSRLLVEHAADAGMLVLGTPGGETPGEHPFNTRALRVASRASVSTVVVPRSSPQGAGIVVGVDGSEFSVAPLAFAAREADRLGEPLTVVHSWHGPQPWTDDDASAWAADSEEEERRILAEAVAGLGQTYPDLMVTSQVVFARAANALSDAARGARMLVVGSHGRHGFEKAWLGSTSEELILAMPTAVAVIRS